MRSLGLSVSLFASLVFLAGCPGPGGSRPASAGGGACPPDALCLRVVPTAPAPPMPGRLVVVWMPIGDGDRGAPPELAYEAPFNGSEGGVAIPYARVRPPAHMQWFPACTDMRRPECGRPAGVATGYVLVVPPGHGVPDLGGILTGAGRVILGYGTQPVAPAGGISQTFPAGVAGGLAPYGLTRVRMFDRMVLAGQGTPFDLVVCTRANPGCELPVPNLN